MSTKNTDVHPIALPYRLIFQYWEPYTALGGVIQLYFTPKAYLKLATPHLHEFVDRLPPKTDSLLHTLYSQICCGWLIFACNNYFTLRAFPRDVKVWRHIIVANLLSDLLYTWAIMQDMGDDAYRVSRWGGTDWFMIATTLPALVAKVLFLLGVGVDGTGVGRSERVRKVV